MHGSYYFFPWATLSFPRCLYSATEMASLLNCIQSKGWTRNRKEAVRPQEDIWDRTGNWRHRVWTQTQVTQSKSLHFSVLQFPPVGMGMLMGPWFTELWWEWNEFIHTGHLEYYLIHGEEPQGSGTPRVWHSQRISSPPNASFPKNTPKAFS